MRWLALESNPEVLTEYIHSLGASSAWSLTDVWGLDDDMLNFIPQPCAALILLFPLKNQSGENLGEPVDQESVFFMKQTIRNACGTIGLLHALANNQHQIDVEPDSPLEAFLTASKGKKPDEIAKILEESTDIQAIHEKYAQKGQTETPGLQDEVDLHFVAIVRSAKEGHVYELDGNKDGPVMKDAASPDDFLKKAAKVSQEYIDSMPGEKSFSLMALVKKAPE